LSWFNSFLSQRAQLVKYKNFVSIPIHATSGVPQGNDSLFSIASSNIILFANDAKMFKFITFLEYRTLEDLTAFYEWCTLNNGLLLNINKPTNAKLCRVLKSTNPLILIIVYQTLAYYVPH